jgi:RsiW-degrading membrane proteinase PrsW (M82 family)
VIVLSALVPAAVWATLLIVAGRRSPALRPVLLVALAGGGAVAAPLSERLIAAWSLGPALTAPAVEEALKAAVLLAVVLLRPAAFTGVREGIVVGALVGVGFTATENLRYLTLAAVQGGGIGLAHGIYLRGVLEGLNHAVFTGSVGAGLGWSRQGRGACAAMAPLLGLAAAVAQHVAWNGLASGAVTAVLCNAPAAGAACRDPDAVDLFVVTPLVVAAAIGPGLLALGAIARRFPGQALSDARDLC